MTNKPNTDKTIEIKCFHCKAEVDHQSIPWGIGHLKGMKTKAISCHSCKKQFNYSINIKGKEPKFMKGLL